MASSLLSSQACSLFSHDLASATLICQLESTSSSGPKLSFLRRPSHGFSVQNSSESKPQHDVGKSDSLSRRTLLGASGAALLPLCMPLTAEAAGLPKICDEECEKILETAELITTPSGLQYKDVKIGSGPSPPVGFQVAANYVAMVGDGKIFDSSLEKGMPYLFRVGAGQVIAGLDEGILTMKVGGIRRLYIPGPLAFIKGLPSAPGRPRVPPNSPVMFDVSLVYVPGLDDE